ncbi:Oxidase ustYa [Pseudocercospora fuligena]|uniref:Oxidase ustYa n=1 Tax=Pseudocercospora fuligena TaxID=685502 RepID=A0A8H6R7V6_9PEZI|nr:Oxidase ustYa [Pseudocercospora fuligena]
MWAIAILKKDSYVGPAGNIEVSSSWLSKVDRSFHSYTFGGFSLESTRWTADVSAAGDDVDQAWADLGVYYNVAILPESEAAAYSIDPDTHVLVTPTSDEEVAYPGYPVNIQVFHQLHCLNMLRQGLFHNVEYYRGNEDYMAWRPDQLINGIIEAHLNHCIDDLRQLIMCIGDMDVIPYLIPPKPIQPGIPDFGRTKQCRNFESMRRWAEANQWKAAMNATPGHL